MIATQAPPEATIADKLRLLANAIDQYPTLVPFLSGASVHRYTPPHIGYLDTGLDEFRRVFAGCGATRVRCTGGGSYLRVSKDGVDFDCWEDLGERPNKQEAVTL